jgi:hypothetical protein
MDKLQWAILTNKLNAISSQLEILVAKQEIEMADFTKLQADVAAQSTVVTSVQTLLTNLSAAIAALKGGNPADQATIDALAASVLSNSAALSAAVTANTPASS